MKTVKIYLITVFLMSLFMIYENERNVFELGIFLFVPLLKNNYEPWLPEALKPLFESLFKGLLSSLRKIF
jgi:hypothetical protein